jgi:hypothetical protein
MRLISALILPSGVIGRDIPIKELLVYSKELVHALERPVHYLLAHDVIVLRPMLKVILGAEATEAHAPGFVEVTEHALTRC